MKKKKKEVQENNWLEKLLHIILLPFKFLFKILLKLGKLLLRSIILSPVTILIWITIIILLVMFFI